MEKCRGQNSFSFLTVNTGNGDLTKIFTRFALVDKNVPLLRKRIVDLEPDVVFVQETHNEQQSADLFGSEYDVLATKVKCVAVKKGVFENLRPVEELDGFEVYSAVFTGGPAGITKKILFINVHFSSPFWDRRFEKRAAELELFMNYIENLDRKGEKFLAAGDFNFDPYRVEYEDTLAAGGAELLAKTRERWRRLFSPEPGNTLKIISSDALTWYFTSRLFKSNMPFNIPLVCAFTLDHVITNLVCGDATVLDTTRRIDVSGGRNGFMDHRALMCNLNVYRDAPETHRTAVPVPDLNANQKRALAAGAALFAAAGLFPPMSGPGGRGFSFVLNATGPDDIEFSILIVMWLIITAVTTTATLVLKSGNTRGDG